MTRRNRLSYAIFAWVLAAIWAAAALVGDQPFVAVSGLLIIGGFGMFTAFSKSEVSLERTAAGDERERSINNESAQIAYMAVVIVAIVGALSELVRGDPGPFTLIGAVGGFTQIAATVLLQRTR